MTAASASAVPAVSHHVTYAKSKEWTTASAQLAIRFMIVVKRSSQLDVAAFYTGGALLHLFHLSVHRAQEHGLAPPLLVTKEMVSCTACRGVRRLRVMRSGPDIGCPRMGQCFVRAGLKCAHFATV